MAGSAKEAVLADRRMGPDHNLVHTIAVHVLTQATMITHLQVPGCPDTGGRIKMDRLAELSDEHS